MYESDVDRRDRFTTAARRKAIKIAATVAYQVEYEIAKRDGCSVEECEERAWAARERARAALLAVQA